MQPPYVELPMERPKLPGWMLAFHPIVLGQSRAYSSFEWVTIQRLPGLGVPVPADCLIGIVFTTKPKGKLDEQARITRMTNIKSLHIVRIDLPCELECVRFCTANRYYGKVNNGVFEKVEAGCLLDVDSHILYSPLPCHVPLPGYESFRFCVSQYEEKDRILLRNLCFVLGAKFVEKLTRKVTHLLCKFSNGPKYEAACKWGIQSVTSEWIFECVKQVLLMGKVLINMQLIYLFQNRVVAIDQFLPKEVTAQDQEAGICTVSQFPTQAVQMISDMPTQFSGQSQNLRNTANKNLGYGVDNHGPDFKIPNIYGKKARLVEEPCLSSKMPSAVNSVIHASDKNFSEDDMLKDAREVSHAVPDVAAAIEDLLEQTSKIYSSDQSVLNEDNSNPHTVFGLSKHWLNRKDDNGEASHGRAGMYDGFSETQTESQVVGYEEDLSGRQMLIDRVRTQSSMN
ncbi:hypothetical protein VNO77_30984 [Canavalia gladiata]|uniref:BRCT domain-containing protein n=1 Tax=Canavalia gladiata TaxID=3824 RepID=A0AAN9Q7I8_CANGL